MNASDLAAAGDRMSEYRRAAAIVTDHITSERIAHLVLYEMMQRFGWTVLLGARDDVNLRLRELSNADYDDDTVALSDEQWNILAASKQWRAVTDNDVIMESFWDGIEHALASVLALGEPLT